MSAQEKSYNEFIAYQTIPYLIANAMVTFFSIMFSSIFIAVSLIGAAPPANSNIYGLIWLALICFVFLVLIRNKIVRFIAKKVSLEYFLRIHDIASFLGWLFLIAFGVVFLTGLSMSNANIIIFSIGLLFGFLPIFFMFSNTITLWGLWQIQFRLLYQNINNYPKRQIYAKKIAKDIKNILKIGNINFNKSDFVYYFNRDLLDGRYIIDDLKKIETSVIEGRNDFFPSLKKIYPEEKFEPCSKYSLTSEIRRNPNLLIKYVCFLAIAIIIVVLRPNLIGEALKLFGL